MKQIPRGDETMTCPFHRATMDTVCHKCPLWVHVRGQNPNTGEPVDEWRCSFAWLPVLLIETAQQARQSGAATESMRNAIVARMDGVRPVAPVAPVAPMVSDVSADAASSVRQLTG